MPAKAGIHGPFAPAIDMDARFRGHDKKYLKELFVP
jgi:hypothetical protein